MQNAADSGEQFLDLHQPSFGFCRSEAIAMSAPDFPVLKHDLLLRAARGEHNRFEPRLCNPTVYFQAKRRNALQCG
jgi:hypothetical protein